MGHLLHWLRNSWEQFRREARIPAPPFRACKRTGVIMYGVWYGRLTPQQAREQAAAWGFLAEAIEQMIAEATQPPSYWSQRPPDGVASG
jgi:hypothetical protein